MIQLNDAVMHEIEKVSEVSQYLWQREWAERNGGNISVDVTDLFDEIPTVDAAVKALPIKLPMESAGRIYYVKGTGQRIRELRDPQYAGCVLQINEEANGYQILWGGNASPDFAPTSEFISHIKILVDKINSGSNHRSVVHTHPLELIALSHHPDISKSSDLFTHTCWKMLPEVRAFVPRGIGMIPYCLPSSEEMADGTTAALLKHDVAIWEKHGATASGADVLQAFDYIDVANKGAKLYLMCTSAGYEPEGVTKENMEILKRVFNL
ncbi:rhamnulose-1-phosphate aldolase [Vibrio diazotrophicus]|uniref:Rhamnulose-1-phosphate aldolase n=1 Tax=Vibrio diazotrophicus TaxID=685 RepID=A0A2J8GQY4_VIBDI|nr:rhamnulose-1-phosphate aldolase [Vibrio diazotrophicus]PNH88428.1 rhamnulose-1-phosphate aldolase [Vibrio diazotrophicus]PNI01570.1 rhamnulose-1-phosphate aldolase [Vibrio diazotrophicus]